MIRRAVDRALRRLDLERAVLVALARYEPERARVIAIGKAAEAMASGARKALGRRIEEAIVVGPADAGHPLPDRRSVRAGERCLALASLPGEAALLVLVSGGASAMVCAPAPGVKLADKQAITRAMLGSGATVQEINVVRKHLSRIKGGGLARAAGRRPVLTLAASDVIGGTVGDIGSGPSVVDASTVAEARALLRRYAPRFAGVPLARTLVRDPGGRLRARIIASPEALARIVAEELGGRLLVPSQAPIEDLAAEYRRLAGRLAPGGVLVRAAEPSVSVGPRAGRGGRSTHLAALVARDLPPGVTFAALATDGVDGSSGTSGAIVDARSARRANADAWSRAVERFDTGPLLLEIGAARPARPSGHNLADLHVLVRRR